MKGQTDTQRAQPVELSLKTGGVSKGTYTTYSKSIRGFILAQTRNLFLPYCKEKRYFPKRKRHSAVTGWQWGTSLPGNCSNPEEKVVQRD